MLRSTCCSLVMIPAAFIAFDLALAFSGELPEVTPGAKPGPAWGAADVQPTPEHPVYFRHTCGDYPGATPPLEWWEGTPTTKKVTGIFGNPPFTIIDIKDPAKPVVVAKNNLLGYKEPAADIIVSTYFKEFDPFEFAGCYKGAASYFMLMSGPVPAGNKLLIQSSAWLYCIGER